jgi:hypothetical protein
MQQTLLAYRQSLEGLSADICDRILNSEGFTRMVFAEYVKPQLFTGLSLFAQRSFLKHRDRESPFPYGTSNYHRWLIDWDELVIGVHRSRMWNWYGPRWFSGRVVLYFMIGHYPQKSTHMQFLSGFVAGVLSLEPES